ncbi:BrnA antitoxin family protein [Chelatococcus asaccharovorans]|nr:BrnA antitoxin family protein [Chelatococcus asaccharovorans]
MCPFHHDGRKDKAIFDANAELASFAETAKRINLSTDQFQGLRYAGGLNGIGGKDFDKGIQDFVEKLNDARHQETDLGKGSRNPVFKTQRLNDGASPVTADRRIGPMPKRRTENVEDPDNPEWTDAMFARSKPASALPPEIRSAFPKTLRARRLSKRTTETVMFHLDKEVLDFYRTGEEDWQTRINDALIEAMRAAKNGSRSSGS